MCALFSRLPSLPSIQLAGSFAGPWHHILELLPLGTWGSEDFVQGRGGIPGPVIGWRNMCQEADVVQFVSASVSSPAEY